MRKKTKHIIITVALSILAVAFAGTAAFLYLRGEEDAQVFDDYKEGASAEVGTLSEKIAELNQSVSELETSQAELLEEKAKLEKQISDLKLKYAGSEDTFVELNSQLDRLNSELSAREEQIAQLKDKIEQLDSVYSVDMNSQYDIITQLNELLENPVKIKKTVTVTKADGTTETKIEERTPTISIYYEDIESGYNYSFKADDVYYTASLIKAPFVLSILRAASEEVEKLKEDPNGEQIYDFNKKFTYTEEFYQSGSGKIKDDEEKTEYTYLELIKYLLMYSDNVAYSVLKDEYGIDAFRSLVYEIGCTAMRKSLSEINASDGGKIMKAIYEFIDSDAEYSAFMYDCMTNSAHTVMIPYAVYPTKVAHKYGWDTGTYHDMGIVYDSHPYVLVVLTDMEEGGDEVNEYIQSVVKLVAQLHKNFYVKK